MALKRLKVRFVGGFLDGEKWTMRALDIPPKVDGVQPPPKLLLEPVLPFTECKGVYELHDRGEDKKVYRYEYRYAETWSEALERLPPREQLTRLRRAILSPTPVAVWELGRPSRR